MPASEVSFSRSLVLRFHLRLLWRLDSISRLASDYRQRSRNDWLLKSLPIQEIKLMLRSLDDEHAVAANNQMLELVRYFFEYQNDAIEDLGLLKSLQLNHVGCLIRGDMAVARNMLEQNNLRVRKQFPSVVLAESLSRKYQREVALTILKAENELISYEIFCVDNGALSEAEIATELPLSFHVAFLAQEEDLLTMPEAWTPLESGINRHEGSRMAYFSNGRTKVELITFPKSLSVNGDPS